MRSAYVNDAAFLHTSPAFPTMFPCNSPSRRSIILSTLMLAFIAGGICIGIGAAGIGSDGSNPAAGPMAAGVILVFVAGAGGFMTSIDRHLPSISSSKRILVGTSVAPRVSEAIPVQPHQEAV